MLFSQWLGSIQSNIATNHSPYGVSVSDLWFLPKTLLIVSVHLPKSYLALPYWPLISILLNRSRHTTLPIQSSQYAIIYNDLPTYVFALLQLPLTIDHTNVYTIPRGSSIHDNMIAIINNDNCTKKPIFLCSRYKYRLLKFFFILCYLFIFCFLCFISNIINRRLSQKIH